MTELSSSGSILTTTTLAAGSVPFYVAIDPSGNIWVTTTGAATVTKLNSGTTLGTFTIPASIEVTGLAVDQSGNIWTTSAGGTVVGVVELSPAGSVIGTYPIVGGAIDCAIDNTGNIWSVSTANANLSKISAVSSGAGFYPYSGPQFAGR